MIALMVVLLVTAGCADTSPHRPPVVPVNAFRAPGAWFNGVRRVVMVPMESRFEHRDEANELRRAIASRIRAVGLFEIIELEPDDAHYCPQAFVAEGRYPLATIVELTERYHADAVIFSRITDFNPYWPPQLGVTLHVVSSDEAITLASIDGVWDASVPVVESAASRFCRHVLHAESVPEPATLLHSPTVFRQFVAHEIVRSLAGRKPCHCCGCVNARTGGPDCAACDPVLSVDPQCVSP